MRRDDLDRLGSEEIRRVVADVLPRLGGAAETAARRRGAMQVEVRVRVIVCNADDAFGVSETDSAAVDIRESIAILQ